MFTCDPTTRAELNAATNKQQWASVLNAALGNTRRIRCKRDANANAADPWSTGTEFRNVGSTGALRIVGGKIVGLGRIKGSTIALAADVSTGISVLRIEGNGRWVQGTLGLASNQPPFDFGVRGNFTTTNGLSVTVNFALSGGRFLPSGTGPAAPTKATTHPHTFELYDWANPNAPTLVQTTTLDTRNDDFVYQDAEVAADSGDVAWHNASASLTWGPYEFAPHLFLADKSNTEAGSTHLAQVLIAQAYRGSWNSYPFSPDYDFANHNVQPGPFKIVMKDQAGTVLHTFEMHDGKAINDPTLHSQLGSWDRATALNPKTNVFMMLPWQNTRPKRSAIASKIYPGMVTTGAPGAYRPSMAKGHYSVLGCEPLITGGYNRNSINGLMNMWAAPQWPRPYGGYGPTPLDPYLNNNEFNSDGHSAYSAPWVTGYAYDPGSYSMHNWYTGPGGPRFDRAAIPSVFSMYMTYPNGNRLSDNTPWRDMVDGYLLGYFNHSNKHFSNPKRLFMDTNRNLLDSASSYIGSYYGGGGGNKSIRINGDQRDGTLPSHYDAYGNMPFNGWARDGLHSYCNAGWGALLFNSPMHAIGGKCDTITQFMISGDPATYNPTQDYTVRAQAWQWLAYPIAWKLAADHPLGFSKSEIENRFAALLERYWQIIYKPLFIDNDQSVYFQSLRNLGIVFRPDTDHGGAINTPGGHLGFYMTHVLQLMKQTGFWSVMYARGGHVKDVLDMQIRNMDLYCFGSILDSSGVNEGGYKRMDTDKPVPTNWAAYEALYPAPYYTYESGNDHIAYEAGATLYANADGSFSGKLDVSDHLYAQYPYMRRDYFPEFPNARLAAAIAKFDTGELLAKNATLAQATPYDQMGRDYNNRYPALVQIAAPAVLGPA